MGCFDTAAFLAVWEPGDSFVPEQHCTVVLEHSGTAAWAHCCTVALALPGIVVEALASGQTGTLVLEFQNIFVPQLFLVRFHTAVLVLWNIAALEHCCTVAVVYQCTAALAPASALAGNSGEEHLSTAPRELVGSFAGELENIPVLERHCTAHVVHPRTVLLGLAGIAALAPCYTPL